MKAVKWVIHILLGVAFLGFGAMKFMTPYADMIADPNNGWATEFSELQVKLIGVVEVLGGLGLLLPVILKKYQMLVPVAALGLAGVMIGSTITRIGRGEPFVFDLVLLGLGLLTFWWRKDWLKKTA
jgi:uncharacterized membrane protein